MRNTTTRIATNPCESAQRWGRRYHDLADYIAGGRRGGLWLSAVIVLILSQAVLAQTPPNPNAPWRIPAPKANEKNPTPVTLESINRGKAVFEQLCTICHGPGGKGNGPAAIALVPHPADLTRQALWTQPDGELFYKITEGRAPMPAWGKALTPAQRWDIVNFIRSLSTRPPGIKQVAVAAAPAAPAAPAATGAASDGYVSRAEFNAMMGQMQQQIDMLKAQLAAKGGQPGPEATSKTPEPNAVATTKPPAQGAAATPNTPSSQGVAVQAAAPSPAPASQTITPAAMQQLLEAQQQDINALSLRFGGLGRRFLIAGDAGVDYVAPKGSPGTFSAGFSPLFLWEIDPKILLEVGLDFSLDNDPNGDNPVTNTEMSLANLSYAVNDHLVIGGGLFAVPFGLYHVRLDPRWINKLPDDPLPYGDGGLAPNTAVGIYAGGGFAFGSTKMNYSFYVTNGPTVVTDDPGAAGSLSFDNYTDPNNNKAVGGRVGFLPIPEMEIGYSFQIGRADPNGFTSKVDTLVQAVDFSYKRELDWLDGTVDARAEWVFSHVGRATYDANGSLGFGPITFNNTRNGGYIQVAYRPTLVHDDFISNLEGVFRYDRLEAPSDAPGGGIDQRYTIGVDYWVHPETVFKVAYEIGNHHSDLSPDAFLFEFSTGF